MGRRFRDKTIVLLSGALVLVVGAVWIVTHRDDFARWYERWKILRDDTAWKEFRGHRYRLTREPSTWLGAEQCGTWLGGHLVTINDAEEQEWLLETFGSEPMWIGCTDRRREGSWRWTSGEKLGFTNWYPGEPNENTPDENFGMINFRNRGKWNDLGKNAWEWGKIHGIVEIEP